MCFELVKVHAGIAAQQNFAGAAGAGKGTARGHSLRKEARVFLFGYQQIRERRPRTALIRNAHCAQSSRMVERVSALALGMFPGRGSFARPHDVQLAGRVSRRINPGSPIGEGRERTRCELEQRFSPMCARLPAIVCRPNVIIVARRHCCGPLAGSDAVTYFSNGLSRLPAQECSGSESSSVT